MIDIDTALEDAKKIWRRVFNEELNVSKLQDDNPEGEEELGGEYEVAGEFVLWRGYAEQKTLVGSRQVVVWKVGRVTSTPGGRWHPPEYDVEEVGSFPNCHQAIIAVAGWRTEDVMEANYQQLWEEREYIASLPPLQGLVEGAKSEVL